MTVKENSVCSNVKRIIDQSEIGRIFNYRDFDSCGPYTAIRTAVVELRKNNYLERVCQGIFVKPDKTSNKSYIPDDVTLAIEIDRKNGAIAVPKGATLDYINGKITKKPRELEFYSNGSGRVIYLPNGTKVKYTFLKRLK